MANTEHLAKLKEGVEAWNQWRRAKEQMRPDLSNADLSNVNLRGANLISTDLRDASLGGASLGGADLSFASLGGADLSFASLGGADLSFASLGGTDLSNANLSGLNLSGLNLSDAHLSSADFSSANLSGLNLSGANLSGANLSGVDLTKVQALTTNFQQATFTGAIIEDWHIGRSTKFDGVKCDYIFRKRDPKTGEPTARLPADPNSTFAPGEFVQRFQILESALETIDLTFTEGIDWKAFFASFQELRQQRPDDEISIQGIERKGEAFIVRLEVPEGADKAAIETRTKQLYATQLKALEAQYEKQLRFQGERHAGEIQRVIEAERQEKATLMGIMTTMANNQGSTYQFNNAKFGGGFAAEGGIQLGGTLNDYSINATPDEISTLINHLQGVSEGFPDEQQATVKETLDDLLEVLQQPEKQTPTRMKRFIGSLLGVAIAVSGAVATATDFTNNVLELSQKLSIPPAEFQPQLQQLQQLQPDFNWQP